MAKKATPAGSRGSTYGTIHSATPLKLKLITFMIIVTGLSVCFWEEFSETRHAHHFNVRSSSPGKEYMKNADGLFLYTTSKVASGAKADLFFLHGFGGHCGRQDSEMAAIHKAGYNVHCLDHQGFGKSDGDRAYVANFDDYVRDVKQFVDLKHKKGTPIVIMGYSMGGLIATRYVEQYHADDSNAKLVLVAPAVGVKVGVIETALVHMLPAVAKVLPKFPVHTADPAMLSRSEAGIASFAKDPLTYGGPSLAAPIAESLRAMRAANADAPKLAKAQVLVLAAGDDLVCPLEKVEAFYEAVPSASKKLIVYKGAFHVLWTDPAATSLVKDVLNWLG